MTRPRITPRDDAGLKKLAGAVLLRAIDDLQYGDAEAHASACHWLNGNDDAGLSFALCSRILGRTPEALREEFGLHRDTEIAGAPEIFEMELAGVAHSAA